VFYFLWSTCHDLERCLFKGQCYDGDVFSRLCEGNRRAVDVVLIGFCWKGSVF